MRKIRSIIIDDEPGNIETLNELLKGFCPEIDVIDSATDGINALDLIRKADPQLIFLDVELSSGNAFDLLDKLRDITFEIIFVTAFNNYAVKAFKYAALDYILKPVNILELKAAVKKTIERLEERNINERIRVLLDNMKRGNNKPIKIGLPTFEGLCFEDVNNIIRVKSEGAYSRIFIKGKTPTLLSKSLKEFENILPASSFCRIHHSHIININFVKKYYKGRGGAVELDDGSVIEVAARKKDVFLEKFHH